jgi:hypothetical protein
MPGAGANVCRLPRTERDAVRPFSQVRLPGRLSPTGPDGPFVAGGQGVAGSNPAVPTIFRTLVWHAQQESTATGLPRGEPGASESGTTWGRLRLDATESESNGRALS